LNFLAKIVPALARAGLLRSYRGSGGGIALGRPPEQITLLDVVEAVDGPIALNMCVMWPDECPRSGTCAVHEVWCDAHASLASRLRGVTISSLVERGVERAAATQPQPA
ncbi:MAG TPA: Rrf2 family transcriptional regulator, partial [Chloroflexota bacterium]